MTFFCKECGKEATHAGFVEVNIADMQEFLITLQKLSLGCLSTYTTQKAISILSEYSDLMTKSTMEEIRCNIDDWLSKDPVRSLDECVVEWALLRDKLKRQLAQKAEN